MKPWWLRFVDWANKWLAPAFGALAGVLGIMWDKDFADFIFKLDPTHTGLHTFLASFIPWSAIGFFLASVACSSLRIFTQKSIGELEAALADERDKINIIANNIETVVNGLLLKLAEKLAFDRGEPSRITIYVHNGDNYFISFGRYSPDPLFAKKGRNLLPDDQGCISTAWHADWCYEGDLRFIESRRRYNVQKATHDAQRMRARNFAVKRINGDKNQPLAVVVVESKIPNRFPEAAIKQLLDNEETYFAEIIGSLRDHIPDPADAKRRGF